jgi:hypothetical protein
MTLGMMGAFLYPNIPSVGASRFTFCQLVYDGQWDARPSFPERLLSSVEMRTSVSVSKKRETVRALDDRLFSYPFLYLGGEGGFTPFSPAERGRLRKYIDLGGTILVDDNSGDNHSAFDRCVREEFAQIVPSKPLSRIPFSHAVYKSFYLLYSTPGRKIIQNFLEGITFEDEDRTPVIYSRNDLGGALSVDEFGRWSYACVPGGEYQRELSARLGVNIIIYALTGNYKTDQVHEPFIKRRQRAL